jgi:sugar O-acyltransferase (sialic acid O-acetyltransferase NeuD family)
MNYLIGAGGHGQVVLGICELMNWQIDSFIDNKVTASSVRKIPCIDPDHVSVRNEDQVLISIGDNAARKRIASSLSCRFFTAIHPSVMKDRTVDIAEGTVVMAGVVINANSIIGKHVILNTASVIDHDCVIGDFSHISPNATLCGNVHIGEGTHIGAGAVIIPGVKIGKGCMVGAGAVVIRDVADYLMVAGNPAREFKKLEQF